LSASSIRNFSRSEPIRTSSDIDKLPGKAEVAR
jgi:hypothetical protein